MTAHVQTILAGVAGVLVTLAGLVSSLKILLNELKRNTKVTKETKELVNGRYTALVAYQNILIAALQEARVSIPPDPSVGTEDIK